MKSPHLLIWIPVLLSFCGGLYALEITEVATEYREASSFVRLSEYITGKEAPDPDWIARTHESDRGGLYYIITFDEPLEKIPEGAVAELSILGAESPEPIVYRIPLPGSKERTKRLLLGLTGPDWPDDPEAAYPTAWEMRLLDGAGHVLAEKQSFVWGSR